MARAALINALRDSDAGVRAAAASAFAYGVTGYRVTKWALEGWKFILKIGVRAGRALDELAEDRTDFSRFELRISFPNLKCG